jgi:hypothetical protein
MVIILVEANNATKKKDNWDKFEIIAKGFLAIFVPVAITLYGIRSGQIQERQSEANRNIQEKQSEATRSTQILMQLLTNREATGTQVKANMFTTLMQYYFTEKDEMAKITTLELISLNFSDQFQLRPLFEKLDAKLTPGTETKRELRRVVQGTISRQIDKITSTGGSACEFTINKNTWQQASCAPPISLMLLRVQGESIWVKDSQTPADDNKGFNVDYFDTPFTDNTKKGELVYSLILLAIDEKSEWARVKLVVFPSHYYSGENKLELDQLMGKYLMQDYTNPQQSIPPQ